MAKRLKVLDSPAEPWFKDGLSFTCTACGNCCTGGPGYVWVTEAEIDRLAEHLGIPREVAVKRYCRTIGGRVSWKERRDDLGQFPCVFLAEHETVAADGRRTLRRGCTIYPVRPLQCRTWPFWDGNLQSKRDWDRAAKGCPGMNKGRAYSAEQIVALRDATDWPDRPPNSEPVLSPGTPGEG